MSWHYAAAPRMIDLETHRRRTGSFCATRTVKKKRHKDNTNPRSGNVNMFHHTWTIAVLLCITVWCCTTVWTPTDSRHGKNRQRPVFREMKYDSPLEKIIFKELRDTSSKLARSESHLSFFRCCKTEKIYPKNLVIADHLQIAFSSVVISGKLDDINKCHIFEKIDACINHYNMISAKLREDEHVIKSKLRASIDDHRYQFLITKNSQFTSRLKHQLKRTKEKKIEKRKRELETSTTSATKKDIWVKDLDLTKEHLRILKSGEDLDDFTIYSAMSLLQKQFPLLMVQSPAIYRVSGYDYSPCQTIQVVHNDAHHWLLLSTLKGVVSIYDSMNTTPTESLKRQMTQLFSPDDTIPPFERRICHKQTGVNDCGLFSIAYAVALMNGIEPDGLIFDQSKMRNHLIDCFEKQELQPFPIYRQSRGGINKPTTQVDKNAGAWKQPRRSARVSQKNTSNTTVHVQNRFSILETNDVNSTESHQPVEVKQSTDMEKDQSTLPKAPCRTSNSNISSVVNLSRTKLTEAEKSVLERGLNFCIVEKNINRENLLEDTYKFARKMKLRAHFDKENSSKDAYPTTDNHNSTSADEGNSTKDSQPTTDDHNSTSADEERSEMKLLKNPYYNPSSSPPDNLAVYINAVKNSIIKLWNRKTPVVNNLTEEERLAFDALQKREDIVIQQADKGGKIVIMDRKD